MNIFDMEFDELMDMLFFSDPYGTRFRKMMNGYLTDDSLLTRYLYIINECVSSYGKWDPDEKFEEFDKRVDQTPIFHQLFAPEKNVDEDFSIVPMSYAEIYLLLSYLEQYYSHQYPKSQEMEFVYTIEYLYRLLKKHEVMTFVDILERIDYSSNNCDFKDWNELTPDQSLIRAQKWMNNPDHFEDVVDLLVSINPKKDYVQDEKEGILSQVYLNKEDFSRAIKHADRVKNRSRVSNVYYYAYPHLGEKDKLYDFFDKAHFEADEITLPYPLLILASNMREKTGRSYKNIVDDIKNSISSHVTLYSVEDRIIDTPDDYAYYLTAFDFFTDWLLEFKEYQMLVEIGGDLTKVEDPKNQLNLFRLCDRELENDIFSLVDKGINAGNVLDLYIKYYKKIGDSFPQNNAKFLDYIYTLRLGNNSKVEEEAYNILLKVVGENNHLVVDSMKNLLIKAYVGAASNMTSYQSKFESLFSKYGLEIDDLSDDIYQKKIYDSLSDSGKMEYKAACIQFEQLSKTDYKNNDAGMLSMSFYRIIENESNKRIWRPLAERMDINQGNEKYNRALKSLKGKNKANFEKSWAKNKPLLEKLHDPYYRGEEFMLGPMYFLQESICGSEKNEYSDYLKGLLFDLFTEEGLSLVGDGILKQWYGKKNRDKFRNPPAHNTYLHLRTAQESKEYVEAQLLKMKEMLKE